MKKYVFSLQNVLNARHAERDAVEIRLARILHELEVARLARNETTRKIGVAVRDIEQLGTGCSSRQTYLLHIRYLEGLQQQLLRHARIMDEIEQRADAVRRELHKIVRACKSLEKLNEREKQEWSTSQRYEEQALIDEVAGSGFFRARLEEVVSG
jgi:flagellar export protein FliJ